MAAEAQRAAWALQPPGVSTFNPYRPWARGRRGRLRIASLGATRRGEPGRHRRVPAGATRSSMGCSPQPSPSPAGFLPITSAGRYNLDGIETFERATRPWHTEPGLA